MKDKSGLRNIIGERLKRARLSLQPPLSMTALSSKILREQDIDVSANAIAKIEIGARYANDFEVAAFARALNVRGDWLLGLTDDKTL